MSAEQIQQLFLKHENPYTKQLFKIDELPTCTFDETMEKLTLVFPFPKGQSDIFQTFQRNVLKCLKIDHRIPSVKILYAEVRIDEEAETDSPGLNPKDTLSRIQQLASPHFIGKNQTLFICHGHKHAFCRTSCEYEISLYSYSLKQRICLF